MTSPMFDDTPFPYSLAGKWASVVRALAIHESHEDPQIRGHNDGNHAFGLLQQHIPFMWEWYFNREPIHDIPWPDAQILAAANFLDHYTSLGWKLDNLIQAYNLGVGDFLNGKRNPEYLAAYKTALTSFGGIEP